MADPWEQYQTEPAKEEEGPWTAYAKEAAPKKEGPGAIESGVRGIGQGITLNFEPNIAGAGAAMLSGDMFGEAGKKAYEELRASEEAKNKAAEKESPWIYGGGQLVGGVLSPANLIVPGVGPEMGIAKAALKVAAPSALIGGVSGYGAGETPEESRKGAVIGALTGGIGGGALGAYAGKAVKPAAEAVSKAAAPASDLAGAAERAGVPLSVASASESPIIQGAAKYLEKVPFAGTPLKEAAAKTEAGLLQAADNIGGVRSEEAGRVLGADLERHIKDVTSKLKDDAYEAVAKKLDPNITSPLTNTNRVAQQILAERAEQRIPGSSGAINYVKKGIQDSLEEGMTFNGIKGLRSSINEQLKTPSLLPSDISQTEFKRIATAMKLDLGNAAERAGGIEGRDAWNVANTLTSDLSRKNDKLITLLKSGGRDIPAEGILGNVVKIASKSTGADTNLLKLAKDVVAPDKWETLSKGVISHLGADKTTGNFSPSKFISSQGYNKLSDEGKNILFGAKGTPQRNAIDDIVTISSSKAGQEAGKISKLGTTISLAGIGGAAAAGAGVLTGIASIAGGRVVAEMLASPASASALSDLTKKAALFAGNKTSTAADAVKAAATQLTRVHAAATGEVIAPEALLKAIEEATSSKPREKRATGGKVMTADQMIAGAERARNLNSKQTEPLLAVPDEAITKALHVANQSI